MEDCEISADSIYNTSESAKYAFENNIDIYMPNKAQATRSKNKNLKEFAKANFTCDLEKKPLYLSTKSSIAV